MPEPPGLTGAAAQLYGDLAEASTQIPNSSTAVERQSAAGEGIGLSIVKRLCEMLDATIEMQSIPKEGTTFRVLFPRNYVN